MSDEIQVVNNIPLKGGPYNRITEEYYIRARDTIQYDSKTGLFVWNKVSISSNRRKGQNAGNTKERVRIGITLNGIQKHIQGHRLAFYITYGYIPKCIDHINGDSADNRLCNLRECTHKQNMANRKINKNCKTGYKGVQRKNERFIARIKIDGKSKEIGRFSNAEDAAKRYNDKAIELYGEFARLNIIKDDK